MFTVITQLPAKFLGDLKIFGSMAQLCIEQW